MRTIFVTLCLFAVRSGLEAQTAVPVLRYATELGGSDHDWVAGATVDSSGNIWVAGTTASLNFPTTPGAAQPQPGGSSLLLLNGTANSWSLDAGLSTPTALAASAAQAGLVYAADANGLHKSTDGGVTWALLAAFPSSPAIYSIAADPGNPLVVYAGNVNGLYKSVDGGTTWVSSSAGMPPSTPVQAIAVDPANSSIVLAGEFQLLFRSTDAGASWTEVLAGATIAVFDPSRVGVVFAVTGGAQVEESLDGGATWKARGTLGAANSIFPDPFHPGTLYASGTTSALRSTDDGLTWSAVPGLAALTATASFAADPSSMNLYASQGTFVVRSSDGFATIQTVGPPQLQAILGIYAGPGLTQGSPARIYVTTQATSDLFIAKLDPLGNILYSTYFGGSAADYASAIAVDSSGSVYVTGTTSSVDFPVTPGAYLTTLPSGYFQELAGGALGQGAAGGSFLMKLSANGTLQYSTFFADAKTSPMALAVSASGEAYLTGSTNGDLPVTPGAYQSALSPACALIPCTEQFGAIFTPPPTPVTNLVFARFDASGSNLLACTYLGEYGRDGSAIAVDSDGTAYIAGLDGYISELNAAGTSLLASSQIQNAVLTALTLDANRNIYVAGYSTIGPVHTSPGAFQIAPVSLKTFPGERSFQTEPGDAYVAKLTPSLAFEYATLLGGETFDAATGIGVDSSGIVTVVGYTDWDAFPLKAPVQTSFAAQTGFLARLNTNGTGLVYSTYVGDSDDFRPQAVALDPQGNAIFAGFTFTSSQGARGSFSNSNDVYVARVDATAGSGITVDGVVNAASLIAGPIAPSETVLVSGEGFAAGAQVLLDGTPLPSVASSNGQIAVTVPVSYQQNAGGAAVFQVQSGGVLSNSVLTPVAVATPGIFSVSGTGVGQGYILNADGTLNSTSNPARMGSMVTIFATGVGLAPMIGGYAIPALPVSVFIDGFYCGGVQAILTTLPGLPGTLFAITMYVPNPSTLAASNPNLANFQMPPAVAVNLLVNGVYSQPGISLAVAQ